jgi:hypothetical protein
MPPRQTPQRMQCEREAGKSPPHMAVRNLNPRPEETSALDQRLRPLCHTTEYHFAAIQKTSSSKNAFLFSTSNDSCTSPREVNCVCGV